MKDLSVTKLIHDNKEQLLEKLEALKAHRETIPAEYKKPCVYMATVVNGPRTRQNGAGTKKVDIVMFNVNGGHKKSSTIKNMIRNGKFPIGYDFPHPSELAEALKGMAKAQDVTFTGDLAKLASSGNDPYAELRAFLDNQIETTMQYWESSELKEKFSSLEDRAKKAEAELEALKSKKNKSKEDE